MVKGFEQMERFAAAARKLMEEGHVDAAAGRFSKTLFMSVTQRSSDVEAAALAAAFEQGWNLITLEFGPGSKTKGPRSFSVSMADGEGGARIVHDCSIAHDGERHILVPHDATFHFAVGPDGIERRHGRPANLAAFRVRAARELAAAAKRADPNPCLEVHTGTLAA